MQTDEKTIWTWIDSSWLRNIYSVRFVALKQSLLIASNRTSPEQNLSGTEPTSIHIGNTDILFSLQAKNLGVTLTNNLSTEKNVTNICRSADVEIRRISNTSVTNLKQNVAQSVRAESTHKGVN